MQDNTFDLLEKKVLNAVNRIQELKTINDKLQAQNSQLETELTEMKTEHDRVQRALDETKHEAAQYVQMDDKRRLIEEKVGDLLEKLDTIG